MSPKDYIQYTIEDFILDENFVRWVNDPQDESAAIWKNLATAYPEKDEQIQRARQVLLATRIAPENLSSQEIRKEIEKFLDLALYPASNSLPAPASLHRRTFKPMRIAVKMASAAAVALLLVTYLYYFHRPTFFSQASLPQVTARTANLIETFNNTGHAMAITLPDCTEVLLSSGSGIQYPSVFDKEERRVYLTGEANFSVTPRNHPFLVIAGEMVTMVLGTRFTVRAFESEQTSSVKVQTGKVSVYSVPKNANVTNHRQMKGLILTANQEGLFEKQQYYFSKSLVPNPQPITNEHPHREIEYSEVPLPEILSQLEDQFGIAIEYDKNSLKSCRITAIFSDETLFEQLDILCKIASVNYQIVDGQIIISGEGCH